MKWLTPDRINNIIKIIMVIIGLWTGNDAVNGVKVLNEQEGGIAAAASEDVKTVGINGGLFGLALLILTKSRKVSDMVSQMVGNDALTTGTYCANLGALHTQWKSSTSEEVKESLKTTALAIINTDMFPDIIKPNGIKK